jgi:hypothetical protein
MITLNGLDKGVALTTVGALPTPIVNVEGFRRRMESVQRQINESRPSFQSRAVLVGRSDSSEWFAYQRARKAFSTPPQLPSVIVDRRA